MTLDQLISELKSLQNRTIFSQKQPIMGWTCAYIPEEIIMALGFVPYRVRGAPISTSKASALMPGNLCPHVLSCLEVALNGEYDFLNGIIIANTSDAMRRLYDVWRYYINTPFTHMLDVPKIVDKNSKHYFLQILQWLIESVENYFNIKFSENSLKEAINTCNTTRKFLKQLYEIKKRNTSLLTSNFLTEITNLSASMQKNEFNKNVGYFINGLKDILPENNNFPNILVTGSFYDQNELKDILEKAGGKIVYEDICTRGKYYEDQVVLKDNTLMSISERYLTRAPCARMIDSERRFNHLLSLIKKHNIDGVIYYALKFDDAYLFEYPLLKKCLTDNKIPVLFIEGDRRTGCLGQVKTRIQAFLERLVPIGREI